MTILEKGELILKERERLNKIVIINRRNEYLKLKQKNLMFVLLTKYSLKKSLN